MRFTRSALRTVNALPIGLAPRNVSSAAIVVNLLLTAYSVQLRLRPYPTGA